MEGTPQGWGGHCQCEILERLWVKQEEQQRMELQQTELQQQELWQKELWQTCFA
jgi:hypothetical protein